jgi:hypothetical protein
MRNTMFDYIVDAAGVISFPDAIADDWDALKAAAFAEASEVADTYEAAPASEADD